MPRSVANAINPLRHLKRAIRRSAPGAPPGTISPPTPTALPTRIGVTAYSPKRMLEEEDVELDRLDQIGQDWSVIWIDVVGLAATDTLTQLRERYHLHPLVMEDVVNVGQRPKVDEYDDHDFIVLRLIEPTALSADTTVEVSLEHSEQLGIVFKEGVVLTFRERPSEHLDPVRARIRRGLGRIRSSSADYLTYALIDAVIDHYMPVLDILGERIEGLERQILTRPAPSRITDVYDLRYAVQTLRRIIRPTLDVVGRLYHEEVPLFSREIKPYLRDCMDHAIRLVDAVDYQRETSNGLTDLHLSSLSQRMNEVMKVLTIISTIFIPLSFVAGVYGMNFDPGASPWNMPELRWAWGYPFVIGLMATMVVGMLIYFHRKGWLGAG
ncbi:MAG: magnesium/cobalt transporter CorA [Haliangiales bacterium]